jgi:hypothetical protein
VIGKRRRHLPVMILLLICACTLGTNNVTTTPTRSGPIDGRGVVVPPPLIDEYGKPDAAIAVGSRSVLMAINSLIQITARDSDALILGPMPLGAFFGAPDMLDTLDPQAWFDQANGASGGGGRFILAAMSVTPEGTPGGAPRSLLDLAVSTNASPGPTDWCQYQLDTLTPPRGDTGRTGEMDRPRLGVDARNVYVTADQKTVSAPFATIGSRILTLPKASIYPNTQTGSCPSPPSGPIAGFHDSGYLHNICSPIVPVNTCPLAEGIVPVTALDAVAGDTSPMLFVNAILPERSGEVETQLVLRSILANGTLTVPRAVAVEAYTTPQNATQPASDVTINTGDVDLLNALSRDGVVYTAHSTGPVPGTNPINATSSIQWFEISGVIGPSGPYARTHMISDPALAYFQPAIMLGRCPGCGGDFAALAFTGSDSRQPPSGYVTIVGGPVRLAAQSRARFTIGDRPCHYSDVKPAAACWGDYPAMSPDPVAPGVVWALGEAVPPESSRSRWTTWSTTLSPSDRVYVASPQDGAVSVATGGESPTTCIDCVRTAADPRAMTATSDSKSVFVCTAGGFDVIDVQTDSVTRHIDTIPGTCTGIAISTAWALGDITTEVYTVRPDLGKILVTAVPGATSVFRSSSDRLGSIAVGPGTLLSGNILYATLPNSGRVWIIDTLSVRPDKWLSLPTGYSPISVAAWGTLIFVTANTASGGRLLTYDLLDSRLVQNSVVGHSPNVVTVSGGTPYVANYDDGTVSVVPVTGSPTLIPVGNHPSSIAAGTRLVYVTLEGSSQLVVLRPGNQPTVAGATSVGFTPEAVAVGNR